MLGDLENDSEIDLEDLEARLYGQVYHSTLDDKDMEPKNILNPASLVNKFVKKNSSRYYDNTDMNNIPQAYQPSRFVGLGNTNDINNQRNQRATNRELPQNCHVTQIPHNLEHNNYNHYQNPRYNDPNGCAQPNPYSNGCQQFMFPGPPAINNIVVISPPATQIFSNTYRPLSKNAQRRARQRKKKMEARQQDSSTQTGFREHRIQQRPQNFKIRNDDLDTLASKADRSTNDVVTVSDSDSSDIEVIVQSNPIIDLSIDEIDNTLTKNDLISNQNSSASVTDSGISTARNSNEILKGGSVLFENKGGNLGAAIEVKGEHSKLKSHQGILLEIDTKKPKVESEDEVEIVEPEIVEQEIIDVEDIKDSDCGSKAVDEDDIKTVECQKDAMNRNDSSFEQKATISNSGNKLESELVDSSGISKESSGITVNEKQDTLINVDSTNDFLDNVQLSQTNFNFELHGKDFYYSKNQEKNVGNNEAYETESSCSTIDIPIKTNTLNEIAFDAPCKEAFDEPNLQSFANFITPKRDSLTTSTPHKAKSKSKIKSKGKRISSEMEDDSVYAQKVTCKSSKQNNSLGLSPISSDNDVLDSSVSEKRNKKKKKKAKIVEEEDSVQVIIEEEKTSKKKTKKKIKQTYTEDVQSTIEIEEDNTLLYEESPEISTPRIKKKKKRKKEKSVEENLDKEIIDVSLENENTKLDSSDETLSNSNSACDKPKKKKKRKNKSETSLSNDATDIDKIDENTDKSNINYNKLDLEINKDDKISGNKEKEVEISSRHKDDKSEDVCETASTEMNPEITDKDTVDTDKPINVEVISDSDVSVFSVNYDSGSDSDLSFCTILQTGNEESNASITKESEDSSSSDDFLDFEDIGDDMEIINVEDDSKQYPKKTAQDNERKQFSHCWNEDMKVFYGSSWGDENFSVLEAQKTMSDDPNMWKILDSDKYMYLLEPKGPKCRRCRQRGHLAQHCPNKANIPVCALCGGRGHYEPRCPNKICTSCGEKINYSTTYCSKCKGFRNIMCNICKMKGHQTKSCPDLWRRYHLTTKEGPLVCSERNNIKPPQDRWCSGCGSQGHFEYACKYYNRTHSATLLAIQSYTPVYEPLESSPKRKNSNEHTPRSKKKFLKGSTNDDRESEFINGEENSARYRENNTPDVQTNSSQTGDLRNRLNNMRQNIYRSEMPQEQYNSNMRNAEESNRSLVVCSRNPGINEIDFRQSGRSTQIINPSNHPRYFINPWAINNMIPSMFPQMMHNPQLLSNFMQNVPGLQNNPFPALNPQNYPFAFQQNSINANNRFYGPQQFFRGTPLFPTNSLNFFRHGNLSNTNNNQSRNENRRSENLDFTQDIVNLDYDFSRENKATNDNSGSVQNIIEVDRDTSNLIEVSDVSNDKHKFALKVQNNKLKMIKDWSGKEVLDEISHNLQVTFEIQNNRLVISGDASEMKVKTIKQQIHNFLSQFSNKRATLPLPKTYYYAYQALNSGFRKLQDGCNLPLRYRNILNRRNHNGKNIRKIFIDINASLIFMFGLGDGKRHVTYLQNWMNENRGKNSKVKIDEREWVTLNASYKYVFQNDSKQLLSVEDIKYLPQDVVPKSLVEELTQEMIETKRKNKEIKESRINLSTNNRVKINLFKKLFMYFQEASAKWQRKERQMKS